MERQSDGRTDASDDEVMAALEAENRALKCQLAVTEIVLSAREDAAAEVLAQLELNKEALAEAAEHHATLPASVLARIESSTLEEDFDRMVFALATMSTPTRQRIERCIDYLLAILRGITPTCRPSRRETSPRLQLVRPCDPVSPLALAH